MILIGHLAADVDLRETKSGKKVANFPIAINRNRVTDDGNKKEVADYHRVVAWDGYADVSAKYLKKGTAIQLEGRLLNVSFEDADGNKHYRTEVVMENLIILTSRKHKSGLQVEMQDVTESEKELQPA